MRKICFFGKWSAKHIITVVPPDNYCQVFEHEFWRFYDHIYSHTRGKSCRADTNIGSSFNGVEETQHLYELTGVTSSLVI